MAQVEERGGGRTTNIEINLVPIIDLMSVLITFLLITAVWSQVSMIQLGSSLYSKKTENVDPQPPPPLADIPLRVDVKEFGFRIVIGAETFRIEKAADGAWNYPALTERLKAVKEKYPTKADAVITVDEVLPYENLIVSMDTMIQSGFSSISVSTAQSE